MSRGEVGHWLQLQLLLVLLACTGPALADTRAWLDRERVTDGGSVALTIQTDQAGTPDYTPLRTDFSLDGQTVSSQVTIVNGSRVRHSLFGITLTPLRTGVLAGPALRVGAEHTAPLTLEVATAPPAGRGSGAIAFVETEVDDLQPYVQQSVGVVVRLYYATTLASGELVLDTPASTSLQRIGEDRVSSEQIGHRRYTVVERRFLLVPERSGPLRLAGARFSGKGVGGFFSDIFARDGGRLGARAPDQTLQVRAMPAGAPQPWLPLQDLRLRYTAVPQSARVGEAVSFEIEASARGGTRAQFPELPVPSLGDAAQVFAEPPQYDETFSDGSPVLTLRRRYSLVPQQAGVLTLEGVKLDWWDVRAGQRRTAAVPDLELQVAAGSARLAAPPVVPATAMRAGEGTALALEHPLDQGRWLWRALAAGFALLWLLTLLWALLRRRPAPPVATAAAAVPADRGAVHTLTDLRRSLDSGGLEEVVHILARMGGVDSLDEVMARLADEEQRQALERMQRALWAGEGDVAGARARLREVFRKGPRWRVPAGVEKPLLDPLYPGRDEGKPQ